MSTPTVTPEVIQYDVSSDIVSNDLYVGNDVKCHLKPKKTKTEEVTVES